MVALAEGKEHRVCFEFYYQKSIGYVKWIGENRRAEARSQNSEVRKQETGSRIRGEG